MTANDIRLAIIDALTTHAGFPVIEADQDGDRPEGTHAVFKFTLPHGKDVGRPDYSGQLNGGVYSEVMTAGVRFVMSVTAIDEKDYISMDAAQALHDWFTFHGYEIMDGAGVVVVSVSDIGDRNSLDDEEKRRGFDVFLRSARTISRVSNYIETVEINEKIVGTVQI